LILLPFLCTDGYKIGCSCFIQDGPLQRRSFTLSTGVERLVVATTALGVRYHLRDHHLRQVGDRRRALGRDGSL